VSLLGAHAGVLKPDILNAPTRETSGQAGRSPGESSLEPQYGGSASVLGTRETYPGNETWTSQSIPNRNLYPATIPPLGDSSSKVQPHPLAVAPAPPKQVEQSILPGVEADSILNTFREQYEPQFPFVVIPIEADSESLHRQRPWVYRAVMLIANERHRALQVETSKRMSLDVMEALTVRGEKSLDMLQGLLLHNAW
jgi:hypothetical protein